MSRIVSTGSYLPRNVVADEAFADDARFRLRGGSARRHHASPDESAIMMATAAAAAALEAGGIDGADVDLIVGYSGMPDFLYPKDTNMLVQELGAQSAAAWTLDTACASAISALSAVDALLAAGRFKTALIVQTMNWVNRGIDQENTDYSSLGDGASAMVVQAGEGGLVGVVERTDPGAFDFVQLRSPFATGEAEHLAFSHDPRYRAYFGSTVLSVVSDLFEQTGSGPDDVDWFIPHQVGPTLLHVWCDQLGIAQDKLLHTFADTANMSAVNIPHILDVNLRAGRIKAGDRLLFFAPGAGMHLAAMLWQV